MKKSKDNAVIQALTKRSTNADFRWSLYDTIKEEIMDRIFFVKNADVPHWYYTHHIPIKYEHEIEDFKHYSQKECCAYICDELAKVGLFAKTMQNASKVFVSWHPDHLKQVKVDEKERRVKKVTQSENVVVDVPWENVATKARIQLNGGKTNLQSNRVKLANFFLGARTTSVPQKYKLNQTDD